MAKAKRNDFTRMTYAELLANYQGFSQSVSSGGNRAGGKHEAAMLREMEEEIARREKAGDTGGDATLRLGGAEVRVHVK